MAKIPLNHKFWEYFPFLKKKNLKKKSPKKRKEKNSGFTCRIALNVTLKMTFVLHVSVTQLLIMIRMMHGKRFRIVNSSFVD